MFRALSNSVKIYFFKAFKQKLMKQEMNPVIFYPVYLKEVKRKKSVAGKKKLYGAGSVGEYGKYSSGSLAY
jgi:hypothetical protein